MTKSRIIFLLASGLVVVPLLTSGLSRAWASSDDAQTDSRFKYLSVFTDVLAMVRQAYVEEPDLRLLMGGALDGATDALDPFSAYVPPDQVKSYLANRDLSRERSGMMILKDRGVAWVVAVEVGGPADQAGLRRGEIVSELGEVSTRSMPTWRVHQILAQPVGTKVQISVVRSSGEEDQNFELTLATARPTSRIEVVDYQGFAHLRLHEIAASTPGQVRGLLSKVGDRTLLLDVRGVAGGDAEAAYSLAALFAKGSLGELRARDEVLSKFNNDVATSFGGEVVILQDRSTQGAAEILASVVGEQANGRILGEQSFGHAGQRGEQRLSNGGVLEMTVAFFTGPSGTVIDEGLKPDLVVRRRFTSDDENAEDLFLEEAVSVLRKAAEEGAKKIAA